MYGETLERLPAKKQRHPRGSVNASGVYIDGDVALDRDGHIEEPEARMIVDGLGLAGKG